MLLRLSQECNFFKFLISQKMEGPQDQNDRVVKRIILSRFFVLSGLFLSFIIILSIIIIILVIGTLCQWKGILW